MLQGSLQLRTRSGANVEECHLAPVTGHMELEYVSPIAVAVAVLLVVSVVYTQVDANAIVGSQRLPAEVRPGERNLASVADVFV